MVVCREWMSDTDPRDIICVYPAVAAVALRARLRLVGPAAVAARRQISDKYAKELIVCSQDVTGKQ